ncbi:MAG: chromosomal replication initiator protein DnaA [Lachnospiraceae bacterium]|nr:chromosomal replication initiator protein DnaA [Lachnospiraceae bacterium]
MINIESSIADKWEDIITFIGNLMNNSFQFDTFIRNVKFHSYSNGLVRIIINMENPDANSDTTKKFMNKNFKEQFSTSIKANVDITNDIEVEFFLEEDLKDLPVDAEAVEISNDTNMEAPTSFNNSDNRHNHSNINPKYTFDTYISGDENKMVYNACLRVAEHPGDRSLNPLFIYGNAGLGKTHLMHAIANKILDDDNTKNVLYVTSEKFTNEIIEAIRQNNRDSSSTTIFRNKYRNVDVLLVDDIQFIIGKEAVQNEFFNTFNELYEQGSQIVLTCDKKPKDLDVLEERMRSRFLSGLPVDVNMPTYETRMAILKQKVEEENLTNPISDEILQYIADNVSSNIRELEGAMNKIILLSRSRNYELTVEEVKREIADMISSGSNKTLTINHILQVICDIYAIPISDIKSKKRLQELVEPRHMCMYIARQYTNNSLKAIGEELGGKDHSTVINGEKKAKEMLSNPSKYPEFNENFGNVLKKLGINK